MLKQITPEIGFYPHAKCMPPVGDNISKNFSKLIIFKIIIQINLTLEKLLFLASVYLISDKIIEKVTQSINDENN